MTDPLIGRILKDSYRIESLVADGGMSRIYLVEQISLARRAVVKMLLPSFNDDDFIQLFLREARVSSQLNHPNIVSVFDFGHTEDGLVFLVMEYLEGASLADIVAQKKGLSLANILWVMEPLCSAIRAAHLHNVVHRDLKPGNVMVAKLSGNDTTVKVVDFGISKPMDEESLKHTQLGTIMGTPGYLAPEQIRGRTINHLADIYGIGAILHFMITGEAPYRGASREIIMSKQIRELPPPLTTYPLFDPACEILQPVLYKAMALEREQRYQTTEEFWREFKVCAQQVIQTPRNTAPTMADDRNYQFVYQGVLAPGADPAAAQRTLKSALKFSDQQLAALFSGKRVVVRKKLLLTDAKRFDMLFSKCGAIGSIEQMDDSTRIVVPDQAVLEGSLPVACVAQPVSVASFIQAGKIPYAVDSPSQANPYIQVTPPPHQQPPPHRAPRRVRRRRMIAGFCALLVITLATLLTVPGWRYHLMDGFMYGTGLAKAQRGISTRNIRLGMSAAFSGSARELGRAMRVGMQAYINELNEAGGIHGRQVELFALDDGYEPGTTIQNLQRLLDPESGAFALLGNVGTPTSKAILPAVLENRILMFGTFSGAQILRNDPPDRYVFNYRASYAEETAALVHYFVKVLGMNPRNIAVFYQNDSFGRDGLSGVANAISQYGVTVEQLTTAHYQRNTSRVADAITQLQPRMAELQGVIIIGTYLASARFIKHMQMLGYQGKYANVSFVGAAALAEELKELDDWQGAGVIVSQVVPMYDSYATGVLEYRSALQHDFPSEAPDFISLEGYIVAKLLCHELQQAGRYFTVESLVDQMENNTHMDVGTGKTLAYSQSDHQASHQVWGSVLNKDGKFEELDLERIRVE